MDNSPGWAEFRYDVPVMMINCDIPLSIGHGLSCWNLVLFRGYSSFRPGDIISKLLSYMLLSYCFHPGCPAYVILDMVILIRLVYHPKFMFLYTVDPRIFHLVRRDFDVVAVDGTRDWPWWVPTRWFQVPAGWIDGKYHGRYKSVSTIRASTIGTLPDTRLG
ncbi:hypothetical protein DERF_009841 [Dermatophagoides farinae]|uniref:Uncharacterized protein n=1 Tax=Dermatophagoides farinae TaxID=6954 RepID=A0A922L663_DERFA|nr:hypothetical protein DERF_009841 [Dermatophagoides farinae]